MTQQYSFRPPWPEVVRFRTVGWVESAGLWGFAILDELVGGLRVLRLEALEEGIEGEDRLRSGGRHPDLVRRRLGVALHALGQFVEYVGALAYPAALSADLGIDLIERCPETECPVADRQQGAPLHAARLQVTQEFQPRSRQLAQGVAFVLRTKPLGRSGQADGIAIFLNPARTRSCTPHMHRVQRKNAGAIVAIASTVHRGAGKERRDGRTTVGGVEMQLLAGPAVLVALRIALRAAITRGGRLLERLRQTLPAVALNREAFSAGRASVANSVGCAVVAPFSVPLPFPAGRSRASIAVPSRLRCPIS